MLSACIVCSKPIAHLTPVTAAGSVVTPALSLAILSMVRAVKALLFLTCSSFASRRTSDTTHMLVISEGNSKAIVFWFSWHNLEFLF